MRSLCVALSVSKRGKGHLPTLGAVNCGSFIEMLAFFAYNIHEEDDLTMIFSNLRNICSGLFLSYIYMVHSC